MNFIVAFLVMIGTLPKEINSQKQPRAYYCDGRKLIMLNAIFVPNVRRKSFQFFVKSPYELEQASMDSSKVPIHQVDRTTRRKMRLQGRWYTIKCDIGLRVGSEQHVLFLTARSGTVFKKHFTVSVEGTRRLEKPLGEGK